MSQESQFPKRFKFMDIQKKWSRFWQESKLYNFDFDPKLKLFSIDTPPPFVSGSLHMGHILNHSWIDFVARYHRMKGDNVYFPQGFDCHGLPVELAVAKYYGVSKDNREEFLAKCVEWVNDNIDNMTKQLDELGYSTDWRYTYRTMSDEYKRKVQISLLEFYEKGLLYREKFPTHFCVNCETSVAKAEVGYNDEIGNLWYIKLPIVEREDKYLTIATTRPEYMEACVSVLINPNDDRYYDLSAAEVKLPIANRIVRVYMDDRVDMNFGTGVVYVCTYGDEMDIKWKLEYNLDEIQIFTENGHMNNNSVYKGLTIMEAREKIVDDLDSMGLLEKIEEYEHSIIIHTERSSCRTPIEYLPVYQWFINVKDSTQEIIESANSMKWYPEKHKQRLIDWAEGLDWNWVISRQRVFGTPIPFWYCQECNEIIPPKREDLPLDPVIFPPPVKNCPRCGSTSIIGEKDVCDCWIDSSISPLAMAKWLENDEFFKKAYLTAEVHRPQGYEIIRTWMFYTLFRCKILTGKSPFSEAMINGMVAGPDGRHMSKSYGNVVSPDEVMPEFGADAVRHWAAMGSLGDDYPFEFTWINTHTKQPISKKDIEIEKEKLSPDKFFKKYSRNFEQLTGASRFITKMWNAYRFLYLNQKNIEISNLNLKSEELTEIDYYYFSEFNRVLDEITVYNNEYNWHEALMSLRSFFWNDLCDNYIEAIKYKFYSENQRIRQNALKSALSLFYKILITFAFMMPFITEEIYSIIYSEYIQLESIHQEQWPLPFDNIPNELAIRGKLAIEIIKILRNCKSKLQIPLNQEISRVVVLTSKDLISQIEKIKNDIFNTIRIKNFEVIDKEKEKELIEKPMLKEYYEELDLVISIFD
ncbi:MAG: valine--tRNA ligase [Candidatus Lokiarchaeota archaeon]|nr:valine--tRNA ligase [Candidatus Lokiarchaeota archaeon]